MKILHVVHGYPPSMGGSQWLVKNLSEQLVSRYNDEVTVFTTNSYDTGYFVGRKGKIMPAGVEIINGVTVHRFPVFNRLGFMRMALSGVADRLNLPGQDYLRTLHNGPIIFGLAEAVAQSKAEVVFATAFPLMHMYSALAGARRAGIPVVFLGAIHTADTWNYDRPMIYRAIKQADAYIAHTNFEREYLLGRAIPAEKITVIGAGVDAKPFLNPTQRLLTRKDLGLNDNSPVITTIGKQNTRKCFDVLLNAMPQIWAEYPSTQLLMAGSAGDHTAKILEMVKAFPPEKQNQVVIKTGFSEEEKPSLLSAGDVFVLPSAYESFGIVFAEAWAAGKPVVGANAGAIPSVIEEGKDGLLFEYKNPQSLATAVITLFNHPAQAREMGQAGQTKVQRQFTWEAVTDKLRVVYRDVIQH